MTKLNENALETARIAGKVSTPIAEDIIEAYLAALQPTDAGGEPVAGWKMVPVEPTEAMLAAFSGASKGFAGAGYRAMVAAAPASPEADVTGPAPDWNYLAAVLEKHMDAFPGPEFIRPFVPALRALAQGASEAGVAVGVKAPTDDELEAEVDATFNEFVSMNIAHEDNSHYIRSAARVTAHRILSALASPTVEREAVLEEADKAVEASRSQVIMHSGVEFVEGIREGHARSLRAIRALKSSSIPTPPKVTP